MTGEPLGPPAIEKCAEPLSSIAGSRIVMEATVVVVAHEVADRYGPAMRRGLGAAFQMVISGGLALVGRFDPHFSANSGHRNQE